MTNLIDMTDTELLNAIEKNDENLKFLGAAWDDTSSKEFKMYEEKLEQWARDNSIELFGSTKEQIGEDIYGAYSWGGYLLAERKRRGI